MEHEFTEQHKDSFVRSGPGSGAKPPATPPGQTPPEAEAKPAAPKPATPKPPGAKAEIDDFVPEKVGNVVDNVFGKLDNLVNDAADYLFGNKKKGGGLLEGDN